MTGTGTTYDEYHQVTRLARTCTRMLPSRQQRLHMASPNSAGHPGGTSISSLFGESRDDETLWRAIWNYPQSRASAPKENNSGDRYPDL